MQIESFRQFATWFVNTLTDVEVKKALQAAVAGREGPLPTSPELRRKQLMRAWTGFRGGPAALISRHFSAGHEALLAELKGKALDELRQEMDALANSHGVRAVAFALVTSGDKYKQELGFELASRRGDEVERPEEPLAALDTLELLTQARQRLESRADVDLDAVERELAALRKALQAQRDQASKRTQALEDLNEILGYCRGLAETWQWLSLDASIPLEAGPYAALDAEALDTVLGWLQELRGQLEAAEPYREALQRGFSASAMQKVTPIQEAAVELTKKIARLLSEKTPPSGDGGPASLQNPGAQDGEELNSRTEQTAVEPGPSDHPEPRDDERTAGQGATDTLTEGIEGRLSDGHTVSTLVQEAEDQEDSADPIAVPDAVEELVPERQAAAAPPGSETRQDSDASTRAEVRPERQDWNRADGEPSRETLVGYFWRALGAADIPGAFWLALDWEGQAEERTPEEPTSEIGVFPSWAALAAHLGLQANLESVRAHDWLQEIILEHPRPVQELAAASGLPESTCARLVLLASVRPTLVAPHTGAWTWFQAASEALHPEDRLQQLVTAVHDVARHGLPPPSLRAAFRTVVQEQRDTPNLSATLEELQAWLDRTRQGRLLAHLGTRVLRYLVGRDSEIGRAVESVLENRRDAVRRVKQVLTGPLESEDEVRKLVQETSEELTRQGQRTISLQARALDQVVSRLTQLASLLDTWLHFQQGQSSWDDDAQAAVAHFIKVAREVGASLRSSEEASNLTWDPPWAIVATDQSDKPGSADDHLLDHLAAMAVQQFSALAAENLGRLGHPEWEQLLVLPALFAPDPPLGPNGGLDLDAALARPSRVGAAAYRRLTGTEALDLHLQRHDYLVGRFLLDHLEQTGAHGSDELRRRFERARAASESQLIERVEEARAKLEETTIEHGLTEEERVALDGRLLSLEDSTDDRIGSRLREVEAIQAEIERHREVRRESLRVHITELRRDLETRYKGRPAEDATREYLDQAERLVNEGDLALADEYLTHAEQALKLGEDPAWDHVPTLADEDPVAEFRRSIGPLIDALSDEASNRGRRLLDAIAQRDGFAGLSMKAVTGQAAKAAVDALKAYLDLKRSRSLHQPQLDLLAKVLEHIGFSMPKLRLVTGNRDRYHVEALMSDGNGSPLPEFGSKRNGRYDVVVIFGQPGQDVIAQTLNTYKVVRNHPIVLYMGRLTLRQRQDWSHYCRTEGLTVLLVDEVLLYFLATRRQHHLWVAVSCGVAWGYANPYEPQGPVPREMFKGRVSERRALIDGRSSFIYGGRQFGKSVLLSVVERELHAPDRQSYAFYEDIRQIGKQGPAEQIWRRIRRALIGARLLDERSSQDPERMVARLTELLRDHRDLRIAFLFDEADAFLDGDQRSDFTEVHRLKRIVERSDWRFRVIFSGLHSVQRFERLKNQPFAHLGKPVVVGPLEPRAAIELVEEPLRALGFQFDGRETLLRILSYTNYHPALIQLFCKELVNLVRQGRDDPPYVITMEDVKNLYLRPQLRSDLVQRFEWTLDLDDRYRALVYAMILAQKGDSDGYRREFTPTELWELAYERWPRGFNDEPDEAFRSYLEELSGLGILMRMPSGRYRLRNGNVVRGLGSIETIEDRLETIARKPAPSEPDFRQLMFGFEYGKRKVFGPLTIGQASDVMSTESEAAVILGSQALLIDRVPQLLQAVAWQASSTRSDADMVAGLPDDVTDVGKVREYVTQQLRKVKTGSLTVYLRSTHPLLLGSSLVNSVRRLSGELKRRQPRDGRVRLAVLLDSTLVYRWMLEQQEDLSTLLTEQSATVILRRWPHAVVKATLADLELPATDEVTSRGLDVTGGWPLLLDWVMERAQQGKGQERDVSDLERLITGLKDQLDQDLEGARKRFIGALGLEGVKPGLSLLRLVDDLDTVASQELVEAVQELSDDEALKRLVPQQVAALEATLRAVGLLDWHDGLLSVEPVAAQLLLRKKAEG